MTRLKTWFADPEGRAPLIRLALFLTLLGFQSLSAEVIDFDSLAPGDVVTNQFPSAIFSSSPGNENTVRSIDQIFHSPPHILSTALCIEDTYIDFTTPVNDLSFWAVEPNAYGVTAQFNVYESGTFSTTVDFFSAGIIGNQFVDLSAFSNVTRLEIVNILDDPVIENGIGWDTFSFVPVPEPNPGPFLAMLLSGVWLRLARERKSLRRPIL